MCVSCFGCCFQTVRAGKQTNRKFVRLFLVVLLKDKGRKTGVQTNRRLFRFDAVDLNGCDRLLFLDSDDLTC